MASNGENAYEVLQAAVGQPEGASDWFVVDQARIDAFAEVTEDRQFIHVDPERAAELSPWGITIAHGFLTLSLLSHLASQIPQAPGAGEGIVMGVNYGFEKVRFVAPVKVGATHPGQQRARGGGAEGPEHAAGDPDDDGGDRGREPAPRSSPTGSPGSSTAEPLLRRPAVPAEGGRSALDADPLVAVEPDVRPETADAAVVERRSGPRRGDRRGRPGRRSRAARRSRWCR